MPLTLITGTYRIVGTSPDGDSVRFYPDDPTAFHAARIAAKTNAGGGAQLRLDAIDALETHYTPRSSGSTWRQQPALADAAAARLLVLLGFTTVTRTPGTTNVSSSTPEQASGYILSAFADKYGRPVSLAYGGPAPVADGTSVHVDVAQLEASANFQLLREGLVYPTFYSRLYVDLRERLARTAVEARAAALGVWAEDVTLTGCTLTSRTQLTDELVLLPKLFRRLAEYLTLEGTGVDLSGLHAFLAAQNDRLFTVPAGQATSLGTLLEQSGQTLRLTVPPEQIVFLEA